MKRLESVETALLMHINMNKSTFPLHSCAPEQHLPPSKWKQSSVPSQSCKCKCQNASTTAQCVRFNSMKLVCSHSWSAVGRRGPMGNEPRKKVLCHLSLWEAGTWRKVEREVHKNWMHEAKWEDERVWVKHPWVWRLIRSKKTAQWFTVLWGRILHLIRHHKCLLCCSSMHVLRATE